MAKKTLRGLMALAVCLFSTGAVQARNLAKNVQFDVFVLGGGSTLVDAQYWTSAGRLYHSRMDLGPKFTIGVAVPYGKLLSIETAYSFGPNNLVVTDTNLFPHVDKVYAARDYIGSVSAVVHAPFSLLRVRPYGEGGVEYDRFSPTPAAISYAKTNGFAAVSTALITHNNKFGVNIGAGLDRKLTKRLTFRIEVRDHITSSPAFGLPPQQTADSAATFPVKGRANEIVYTAGFVFRLGKP